MNKTFVRGRKVATHNKKKKNTFIIFSYTTNLLVDRTTTHTYREVHTNTQTHTHANTIATGPPMSAYAHSNLHIRDGVHRHSRFLFCHDWWCSFIFHFNTLKWLWQSIVSYYYDVPCQRWLCVGAYMICPQIAHMTIGWIHMQCIRDMTKQCGWALAAKHTTDVSISYMFLYVTDGCRMWSGTTTYCYMMYNGHQWHVSNHRTRTICWQCARRRVTIQQQ